MRTSTSGTFPCPETTGCSKPQSKNCEVAVQEAHLARSDLLISLVKSGTTGDKRGFRSAAEAIIAEERSKRHDVLAERLAKAIQSNGSGTYTTPIEAEGSAHRGRDFIAEVMPRRRLEDLILPKAARQGIDELVEEMGKGAGSET